MLYFMHLFRSRQRFDLKRMRTALIEHEVEELGPSVMADGIHHPLALDDETHVEIGNQNALTIFQRRHQMRTFWRDDRGHAAAAQRAA